MKVKKIYKFKSGEEAEYVFFLESGRKIIKRSDDKIKKLNLEKWEEISFVPEDFQQIDRKITDKEQKELESFIESTKKSDNKSNSIWKKIKNIFK